MGPKSAQLDGQQCVRRPLPAPLLPLNPRPRRDTEAHRAASSEQSQHGSRHGADPLPLPVLPSRQQEAYVSALQTSASYFRALLSSSSSKAWKPIAIPSSSTSGTAPASLGPSAQATAAAAASRKGKEPASSSGLDPANVVVHRRSGKTGEVYRATLELPIKNSEAGPDGKKPKAESEYTTEGFRAVLATAEIRALCELPLFPQHASRGTRLGRLLALADPDPSLLLLPPGDRMVDSAQTVEQLDADSRIVRTAYRLGWPSRCVRALLPVIPLPPPES